MRTELQDVEILAHIERDGERYIVVRFPEGWGSSDLPEVEVMADDPYWWRQQGRFVDRSEECS